MAFTFQIIAGAGVNPTLVQDAQYAIGQWSNVIQGPGANLVVKLEIVDTAVGRAAPVVNSVAAGGTYDGRPLATTSVGSELTISNMHANNYGLLQGTGADVLIQFDPDYVPTLFLDPTPTTSNDIPANKLDAISVIEHEFGHALGITGYYPLDADSVVDLPGNASLFDQWVRFSSNGSPSFIGPNAMNANHGQPVPLSHYPSDQELHTQNMYHLGTNGDAFTTDLMTGSFFHNGFRYEISALDQAILRDIGYTTAAGTPPPTKQLVADPRFNVKLSPTDLPPLMAVHPAPTLNFPAMSPTMTMAATSDVTPQPWMASCEA